MLRLADALFPADVLDVRRLFAEYVESIGVDLSSQDIDAELAGLPGRYAQPAGCVLLAWNNAREPVGCVAMRPLPEAGSCEIKRLFVRPHARGGNVGRELATGIVARARTLDYARIRLDTLGSMNAALALYASLGFRFTKPYHASQIPGTVYLALEFDGEGAAMANEGHRRR